MLSAHCSIQQLSHIPFLSSEDYNVVREEHRRVATASKQIAQQSMASRSKFSTVEQQVAAWKEERRNIVNRHSEKAYRYESETYLRTDLTALMHESGVLRARSVIEADLDPRLLLNCQLVEKRAC